MSDLLFTALILVLLYYCFFYLPQQKKLNAHQPLKHQETQTITETADKAIQTILTTDNQKIIKQLEQELNQKRQQIIDSNKSYWKLEEAKNQLEANQKADEQVLEQLLKEMQELTDQLA